MEALTILIKPVSGNCGYRCKYCFYDDVTKNRGAADRGMMSLETLELVIKKALSETTRFAAFLFQGGEPTLAGLDFFVKVIELQKRYNVNGTEISNSIQTSGALVDGEWARFFAANKFLVGLSIDGWKDAHDFHRTDAQGRGTHARAMKAANALREAGAEFNILSVVTGNFARHPDRAYNFYKKNNFKFVQLIPCIDPFGKEGPCSLDAEGYGKFLCRFFDLWYEDFAEGNYISVRTFDNYIRMLMGFPPENCAMAGVCRGYPLVEADGSVYPCDFYVLDRYKIGHVKDDSFIDMLSSTACIDFCRPSAVLPDECKLCPIVSICRNGCRRDREPEVDGRLSINRYCTAYKMFFAHALPRMQDIAVHLARGM